MGLRKPHIGGTVDGRLTITGLSLLSDYKVADGMNAANTPVALISIRSGVSS